MTSAVRLVGRRGECDAFDRLLSDVRAHGSAALVLRGDAGIGKTALMDYLASRSTGCQVVRVAGVESEMELAFAGVHQMCTPLLDRMDSLPGPQHEALATAFGLLAGDPADRFMIGLGVLSLLSAAAEQQPLVCLIDDAQWLDQVSLEILAFVARRLAAEAIAVVFAVREPADDRIFAGLPQQTLRGLGDTDARALLESGTPGRLDERVRDRIVAETRGNPLALLELPRSLTPTELAGGFGLPTQRPLTGHIEQSFVRRIASLPRQTQRLLLLAAADPLGDPTLLQRAAQQLGIERDVGAPAEEDGLIEFGPRVRFRHPLVRSAAYQAADAADRRAAHQALVDATDAQLDPDRRAWHRAHAAAGADDDVADDLEQSAQRAQRRGGVAAAAAFLERAAELTADPARRAARALAAAEAKLNVGASDVAETLVGVAETAPLDDLQRARVVRVRAQIVFARRRGREAPPLLLDAARRLEGLDDRLARETYIEAVGAAIFAGRLGAEPTLTQVAAAARQAPPPPLPPRPIDVLLDGVATRFTDGYAASTPLLRSALHAVRGAQGGHDESVRWFWLAWLLAADLWDDALMEELATRSARHARESAALGELPLALVYGAVVHIYAGEFASASALISESDTISAATGNPPPQAASVLLAAWRGDETDVLSFLSADDGDVYKRGEGRAIGHLGYMNAILYNGLGRYDEALSGAQLACKHDDVGVRGFALVELIEAVARGASPEGVAGALDELEERAVAAGTDWALGILARSRALLTAGDAADALYREAIERLAHTRVTLQLARAQLLYGEWLRRERRRVDAREQLRAAYETFSSAGTDAFAERARRELMATGETVRSRATAAHTELTPQEMQIARLAAAGRTNQEIASELFISASTVEYHLRKVFRKLGLTTRRDLPSVVAHMPR